MATLMDQVFIHGYDNHVFFAIMVKAFQNLIVCPFLLEELCVASYEDVFDSHPMRMFMSVILGGCVNR